MNNWNMGGWNPSAPFNTMLPHYDIIKVNGEAGAKAFKMACRVWMPSVKLLLP